MVTAIVLINTEPDKVYEISERVSEVKGVSEAYSVGGRYDIVAVIRVKDNERIAELVTGEITKIQGIRDTETLIAFKSYSSHDLEKMFSIGIEE